MKTRSYCLFVCFCFTMLVACETKKPEFLLVGIFHQIPDSLSCNWKAAYEKILKYQPDQLAVEYVHPSDEASLPYAIADNYRALWDSVLMAWEGKKLNAADSIKHYFNLLQKKEDNKLRFRLWEYYHLGLDIGNRDYQTYLLHKTIEKTGELPDTTTLLGKAFRKRYEQTVANRKDGEFFHLVFPLADQLGIDYLHPTDDKSTYPLQSEAWARFLNKIDSTPTKNKLDSFWKAFVEKESKELAACNGLSFVNSPEWLSNTDYGQAHIADDINNKDFADYSSVWYKRNQLITAKIIEAAKKSNAEKMVVFYGYMHVFPVKRFLEQAGYRVKLLGDLN